MESHQNKEPQGKGSRRKHFRGRKPQPERPQKRTEATPAPYQPATQPQENTTQSNDPLAIISAGIKEIESAYGLAGSHMRYKAIRALAYYAFCDAISQGYFDTLVAQVLDLKEPLPRGWGL